MILIRKKVTWERLEQEAKKMASCEWLAGWFLETMLVERLKKEASIGIRMQRRVLIEVIPDTYSHSHLNDMKEYYRSPCVL